VQVSISEGARLVGMDRKTLYKHIKSGRLSATRDANNQRQVAISELERVYGELATTGDTPPATIGDTNGDSMQGLLVEVKALRLEVAGLRAELNERLALPAPPEKVTTPDRKKTGGRVLNAIGAIVGGVGAAVEALK
jgi:hypothetical protein